MFFLQCTVSACALPRLPTDTAEQVGHLDCAVKHDDTRISFLTHVNSALV